RDQAHARERAAQDALSRAGSRRRAAALGDATDRGERQQLRRVRGCAAAGLHRRRRVRRLDGPRLRPAPVPTLAPSPVRRRSSPGGSWPRPGPLPVAHFGVAPNVLARSPAAAAAAQEMATMHDSSTSIGCRGATALLFLASLPIGCVGAPGPDGEFGGEQEALTTPSDDPWQAGCPARPHADLHRPTPPV